MKHLITAVFATFAAVAVIAAPSAAGTWKVTGDVAGNAVVATLTLTQEGETLAGTIDLEGADKPSPVTGSVKDTSVTLTFDLHHGGSVYTNTWNGTLGDEGTMKGAIDVQGMATGEFTARKQ